MSLKVDLKVLELSVNATQALALSLLKFAVAQAYMHFSSEVLQKMTIVLMYRINPIYYSDYSDTI